MLFLIYSLSFLFFCFSIAFLVLRYVKRKLFGQIDVKTSHLGEPNECGFIFNRAIVIGGSISGLLAAGTLSKHAREVIIIERKQFHKGMKGSIVPQADQGHILLTRGLEIWNKLFPNIHSVMAQHCGGRMCDWGADFVWNSIGGLRIPLEKGEAGVESFQLTRSLLEELLREEVFKLKNVKAIDRSVVVELLTTTTTRPTNKISVKGVRYRNATNKALALDEDHVDRSKEAMYEDSSIELRADLVVDCSGLTTQTPKWFSKLGYPISQKKVKCYLGYAGLLLMPPKYHNFRHTYCQMYPPSNTKLAGFMPVEDGKWIFTLGGINKDYPPKDREGFEEFSRQLPNVYEVLSKSEPLTEIKSYLIEGSRYNYFEELNITGFVALGDSVASFNPIYAQGMTVAAEGALLMDQLLRRKDFEMDTFCREFQHRLSNQLVFPWLLATSVDLCFPKTIGGSKLNRLFSRFIDKFFTRFLLLGTKYKYVHIQTVRAFNMVYGYIDILLDPGLFWYILFG